MLPTPKLMGRRLPLAILVKVTNLHQICSEMMKRRLRLEVLTKSSGLSFLPAASRNMLSKILAPYGKPCAITESMLQVSRTDARAELFGKAEENIKYANSTKCVLHQSGHNIQLHFTGRHQCFNNLHKILISNKITCQNHLDGTNIDPSDQMKFINNWKEQNGNFIITSFGKKTWG